MKLNDNQIKAFVAAAAQIDAKNPATVVGWTTYKDAGLLVNGEDGYKITKKGRNLIQKAKADKLV